MNSSFISEALKAFYPLQNPVHLFFMRHGQSIANRTLTFQGRSNSELSEEGRTQAALSGNYFADYALDGIYSSPLIRANETARIAVKTLGLDPTQIGILEELQEIDTGIFSDKSIESVRTGHPELWQAYQQKSWDGVPEAEGQQSLQERALSVWNIVAKKIAEGKRSVLCVSHGGIMQWIVKMSFTQESSWMPLIKINNCGIFHLYIRPSDDSESILATWQAFNHTLY